MCQQFYVIRRMPAPGSAAEKAYHARLERKGKPIPGADTAKAKADAEAAEVAELAKQSGQRQQPASKKRKKSKAAGAKPAGQSGAKAGIQDTPKPATQDAPTPKQNGQKQDGPPSAGKKTGNAAKPPTT
jgi:YidC/Oxa1 family membrane protein insertase